MIDLHIHTARCGHASGTMEEYVAAARAARLSTIAFADHLPLPKGFPSGYAMRWPELPDYVADVAAAREAAAREGGPEVLCGIEADYVPGMEALVDGALHSHRFDVVLGSVHFLDGWPFDDPDQADAYAEWSPDALWERYFDELSGAAATRLFDVIAHPDLVKKLRCFPESDPTPWYEEAAAVFAESGVAIEVNTAGLRKPCAELYPSSGFLAACLARGVPATIGSDAHRPSEVGMDIDAGLEALAQAGYRSVLIFRGREAEELPL